MADIALAIAAKLAEYLVDPLLHQGQYLFCARNITKTLETEKQKLTSTQDGVQARVHEARNKTENVVDAVDKWLAEVESHIDEVQKLEQQMKDNNSCFQGRCPTWRRYRLCRQMTKMIEATKDLNQRSEFNPFSYLAPLPQIEYFSSGNFVYFQSTKLASDQLLAALQDNDVDMIGLYGMGGSGKTTLVKEVGKSAKDSNIFDQVVFATVSQTPNMRKIQGELADDLSFKLEEESEVGRAKRLSMRLRSGERILVILDDVWSMINLEDVGIFSEECPAGCKILLTTRRIQVCSMMNCERMFPLNLLSDEESWTLFQKHVRTVADSLSSLAKGIVKECKGLPIAIQAVGASLKGKSEEEWKVALRRLRDAKPINVEPGVRDVFSCLQLSYDYLRSDEVKSLFLLCSMYPEDADISIEDLFMITRGLGMFDEFDTLEDARNNVSACINNLVDSCLLIPSEERKGYLRMHDTIRDMALWISSQEKRSIVVNLENNMKMAVDGCPKDCYAFTSWCDRTCQFPQRFDAPKLEILLLQNIEACEFSEENFRVMETLKVMQMTFGSHGEIAHFSFLSNSMELTTNLRTLRLKNCQLGDDLSWLLSLKRLEVLDLQDCQFKELPPGLEELNELKVLDLWTINEQSFKIIESCTQLQELYASEIKLSRATHGRSFSNDANFPRLKRFELTILRDDDSAWHGFRQPREFAPKVLELRGFEISALRPFVKDLLQHVGEVSLVMIDGGFKNIVPDLLKVAGKMNELATLNIYSCLELECLADVTSHHINSFQIEASFFPKLINLQLCGLTNMREMWLGQPLLCFFEKLQELYIYDCPMLTSLFPKCVARAVLLLRKLTIEVCTGLKSIIEEDGDGNNKEIISTSGNAHLVFSNLESLTIISCHALQHVFSNSCIQGLGKLKELSIQHASQLKYAFGQHEDEHQDIQIKLPVLEKIYLEGLWDLLSIFPKNFHFPCLKDIYWVDCPNFRASCVNVIVDPNTNVDNQFCRRASTLQFFLNLEKFIVRYCAMEGTLFALERDAFMEVGHQNRVVSPLHTLELQNLRELKFVWEGSMEMLSLQNLRTVKVSKCNNLRNIFSPVTLRSMPLLESVEISDCHELEEIMSGVEVGDQNQCLLNDQSPHIWFPNLKTLRVDNCNKLKCLFSVAIDQKGILENVLPNLRRLVLKQVPSLKELFQGLSFPNDCLPQLLGSKLEELILGSPFDEVKLIWRAPSHISNLVHLQKLELSECNKLKFVLGDGIHGRTLQLLRDLTIINCEELEELVTQDNEFQTCFPKLEQLRVEQCNKLKSLFTTCDVTTLVPFLRDIEVRRCAVLEELFGSSSDNIKEIELPKLERIELSNLTSLVGTCQGFKLSAVNIRLITMWNCPKFSTIMGSTGSAFITIIGEEEQPDANNGSQQLDEFLNFYPTKLDLEELELEELSELRLICMAFSCTQNLSFQYLHELKVFGCGKLKCMFSMSVWGSLPHLTSFQIIRCEELQEIMEEPHHQNVFNPNIHIFFPELKRIKVKGCNKLKRLFRTVSIGMFLPKLDEIEVSEAAQMEELFSHTCDEVADDANLQQIELPCLQRLNLSKLPALTHFSKGLNLNAPKLLKVDINECPKFDSYHPRCHLQPN